MATPPVPPSHLDLLTAPVVGVLTTMMPDGQPHSCLVWVDYDGQCARVNTTLERQSGRNLLANRRLSLLDVSRRRQWQARAWCCRRGRQVDQWRTASRLVVGCRATWRRAIDQVAALVVAYARTRLNIGHRRL